MKNKTLIIMTAFLLFIVSLTFILITYNRNNASTEKENEIIFEKYYDTYTYITDEIIV